ncbi:hypothetical protein K3495_g1881 [Podosphaera aphanis]|nr:hypothetical protein K3495_g1881 [Podosphaera aphanis]
MQMLSKANWISKIDVRSAFHRLRVAKGDEYKTAFRTIFGSFESLVTPFGLSGAPAAFQRWINQVLGDLVGNSCSAYVKDVVIFSNGFMEDHWSKVNQILERLHRAGLRLDPQKCDFAKKKIKYLGFVINVDEGVIVDPEKIRAITSWEAPTDIKGVRSFLGFANFYRNFIGNFAQITSPLQNLTKKGTPFRWDKDHHESFERLKSLFITAPVLALWDGEHQTILETDPSGWATGGCLSQFKSPDKLQPVAYFSKKLSPAECNYDIHVDIIPGLR